MDKLFFIDKLSEDKLIFVSDGRMLFPTRYNNTIVLSKKDVIKRKIGGQTILNIDSNFNNLCKVEMYKNLETGLFDMVYVYSIDSSVTLRLESKGNINAHGIQFDNMIISSDTLVNKGYTKHLSIEPYNTVAKCTYPNIDGFFKEFVCNNKIFIEDTTHMNIPYERYAVSPQFTWDGGYSFNFSVLNGVDMINYDYIIKISMSDKAHIVNFFDRVVRKVTEISNE